MISGYTIQTHLIKPYENIMSVIESYCEFKENQILIVSSKIISISEGRILSKNDSLSLTDVLATEAQKLYFSNNNNIVLTLTDKGVIPSAGIDESNIDSSYILYPKDCQKSCKNLWKKICKLYNLKKFGLIISDSLSSPFRRGVQGKALAWYGFEALKDYVGKKDLVGKNINHTKVNVVDSLAALGVLLMGEGKERTPLAIIDVDNTIRFSRCKPSKKDIDIFFIKDEEDLYKPILKI